MSIGFLRGLAVLAVAALMPMTGRAASDPYAATLAKSVDAPREVVAGDIIWHCEGTACVTRSEAQNGGSLWTCRQLTEQVGDVTAYGSATHPFDADHLAKCNAH